MELQLGLALSLSLFPTQMISSCFDLKQAVVSSHHGSSPAADHYCGPTLKRKRRAFTNIDDKKSDQLVTTTTTLPLLSFPHNQPNEEDEDDHANHSSTANNRSEEDEDGVVGWPPVKSWRRKKKCRRYQQRHGVAVAGELWLRRRRSSYVKVKMDGVGIARKVDLSQHHSFATLSTTLLSMFGISDPKSSNYVLTYQVKDGDWFLVNNVPWRSFEESVHRLKLQLCNNFTKL